MVQDFVNVFRHVILFCRHAVLSLAQFLHLLREFFLYVRFNPLDLGVQVFDPTLPFHFFIIISIVWPTTDLSEHMQVFRCRNWLFLIQLLFLPCLTLTKQCLKYAIELLKELTKLNQKLAHLTQIFWLLDAHHLLKRITQDRDEQVQHHNVHEQGKYNVNKPL